MTKAFVGGPLTLLVDNDSDRIEYLEHVLFQKGYQACNIAVDKQEQELGKSEANLVLTYIPLEAEKITARKIPIIFMTPDNEPAQAQAYSSNPLVACLPASMSSDVLIEKITGMIGS
ncbi:MAG: hypothetical protein GY847_31675 [Proteobacteria bacterium]|nr:hypothetical protein [Pseudomonadota bacterium]